MHSAVSIKEKYLNVDMGGATYVGELVHGFYPSVSIHITRCRVFDYPVRWDILVDISGVLLGLVHNDG